MTTTTCSIGVEAGCRDGNGVSAPLPGVGRLPGGRVGVEVLRGTGDPPPPPHAASTAPTATKAAALASQETFIEGTRPTAMESEPSILCRFSFVVGDSHRRRTARKVR